MTDRAGQLDVQKLLDEARLEAFPLLKADRDALLEALLRVRASFVAGDWEHGCPQYIEDVIDQCSPPKGGLACLGYS